jgi:hypothetical protein
MARRTQHEWFSIQQFISRRRDPRQRLATQPHRRRLRFEPLEDRRLLAVVTIDTLDDTVDFNDGVTSLREALFATNLVGGADTIEFAASLTAGGPATILLTQGELKISDALVIHGPGAALLTIDASGNDPTPGENNGDGNRIFNIDDGNFSAQLVVSISGLALTGGDPSSNESGGAILNRENLTITDSTISGNSAGIGGGVFSGQGGDLTVTLSTISDNSAYRGGGISNSFGKLTITDSMINDNSASTNGGGVYSRSGGDVTVTGSTISGNSTRGGSGGGIAFTGYNSAMAVTGSTISGNQASGGNGGGIYSQYGNLTLSGTTINGNSADRGGGIFSHRGDLTMIDTTLSGNSTSLYGGGIFGSYGNLAVTRSTISGNSAGRTGGGISASNVTVSNSSISGNSAGGGGGIYSRGGPLTVTSSIITDNTATGTELFNSGGGISSRGDLTVTDSTINDNSANLDGGGIDGGGNAVTVTNSTVSGNSAGDKGGGITGSAVTVTNSTISDNSAGTRGGGISGGDIAVTNSTISDNSAGTNGGGIESRTGDVTMTGSTLSGNSAVGSGGGIFSEGLNFGNYFSNTTVTNSTISGNSAGDDGGGIFSRFGDVTMTGSTLSGNSAVNSGGGLYVFSSVSAIRHSTVTDNSAEGGGGGAFIFGGSLALDHTILAANFATIGPDLTGLIGTVFDVRFSLIGNNAHSGLAATPTGTPDANGNLIGPVMAFEPLFVYIDMAAMGDFEAGPDGDSFRFEYSIDGGAFQPLFTSSVDEAASQTYTMDSGNQVVRDDPLSVNGVVLNKYFQGIYGTIPASSGQVLIRFTATNDGPSEAFAWRNLIVDGENSGSFVGAAVQHNSSSDIFATYTADPDYTISGDMFGIRSRSNRGIPGLPADIVDDSNSTFPGDVQGIISGFDEGRFFGVVDTVNGVGSNTNSATWTFNNSMVPIDPKLGPLANNGGPTMTHALLAGSPAIDAGNPAVVAGVGTVPLYDQRGAPFGRVVNGDAIPGARIDIGALEMSPIPPALLGDYNHDGSVDAADYSVWRDTLHANVAPYSGADSSGNGVVDQADYGVWRAHFGQTLPPPGTGSGATAARALVESVAPPAAAASSLPARSARGVAALRADAVFTMLGQRTPARSTAAVVRTVLPNAAVDAAVSDSLLPVRRRRAVAAPADDSIRSADVPLRETDTRRERTGVLEEKWRTAVRESVAPALIMV